MTMLPTDPFALAEEAPVFEPAERRTLELHGGQVELCWVPQRGQRSGKADAARPSFPSCRAERILAEESLWSAAGLALTPNLHPFAERHLLLWSRAPRREPDATFLAAGFELADRCQGSLLVNSIGAAASIPWLHAHLLGEQLSYLDGLPTLPTDTAVSAPGVEIQRVGAPFPAHLLALRGGTEALANAVADLLRRRTTPAFSLVYENGRAFVLPREVETPAPHFPQALGSAELWGRWCFEQEAAFASATPESLDSALRTAGRDR
jgi:hypothetical protein